jgi:hypothetical protein
MIEGKIFREYNEDHFMFSCEDPKVTKKIVKALKGIVKFDRPTPNY